MSVEDLWARVEWAVQYGAETTRITALMEARACHREVCAELALLRDELAEALELVSGGAYDSAEAVLRRAVGVEP